ncbi:cyclophilin-like fold protein [Nocardiopsis valliformis]|uniref:cyclophilin-like fold protein n=1 Tax=Nocardiopsis valliformis TaxID=239974 RepID=UPI00034A54F9|nr:cyclophilin-like fold protein [Nocardiopsis valliformis]
MRLTKPAAGAAIALALAACGTAPETGPASSSPPTVSATPGTAPTPGAPASGGTRGDEQGVIGTVVRFTAGSESVDVTIGEDSPATRDFLGMLPLTLELEEFSGREKIAYLPRDLEHQGSPGSDPEDGDLIYFVPWGNLGFYYNTAGVGYSDQTLHLGTYDASAEELARFEGRETTVEIVE